MDQYSIVCERLCAIVSWNCEEKSCLFQTIVDWTSQLEKSRPSQLEENMRYLRKLLTVDVVTIPLLPVETILKVIQSANIPPEAWLDCLLTALSSDSNGDQNAISFDFTPVIVPTLTMTFNRTPSPQFKPTPSKHRSPAVNQNFDDSKPAMKDEPKPVAISKPPPFKPKSSNDSRRLASADPKAFEAKFCRQRQEAIDNMTYRTAVNSWTAKSLDEVVKLILQLSSGKSLIDRAWIVFYWVSQNIQYDVDAYFSGKIRHQTSEDVFNNRKGVCDAFGTIFQTLCTEVQIECRKISGYAKGYSFKLGQTSFSQTNHAWNVIRLKEHWYLIDSTWGTGHLDDNNRNKKELNTFYFLVRPEQMIYTHFPEDPKWQLLVSPVSMHDFFNLPFVYPNFFEVDLDIIYPQHSSMTMFNSSIGLAEVLLRAPSNTVFSSRIEQNESEKIQAGSLVQYDAGRELWQCLFAPRRGGLHTLTVFAGRNTTTAKHEASKTSYSASIQFGLQVPTDFMGTKTFPITYGLFTERKCYIFEPLDATLKPGSTVTMHCRIPGAHCARLMLDGNWLSEDILKDDIFKRQFTVPRREVMMYAQFRDARDSSSYHGLFKYLLN